MFGYFRDLNAHDLCQRIKIESTKTRLNIETTTTISIDSRNCTETSEYPRPVFEWKDLINNNKWNNWKEKKYNCFICSDQGGSNGKHA